MPSAFEFEVPELPAEITAAVPVLVARSTAAISGSSSVCWPEVEPRDMFKTSAPSLAESSIAPMMLVESVVAELAELEKAFIANNCASGATPITELTESEVPLAATIPATCIPCCWLELLSVILSLLSE